MQPITAAAAQFENKDGDQGHNLARIRQLTRRAVGRGADIVCFHEGCIPAYSWLQPLSAERLAAVSAGLGSAMSGIEIATLPAEGRFAARGW